MEIEDHISQWVSRIRDSEVEYMKTVEAILSDEKLKNNDDADKLIFAINPETCAPAYIALLFVLILIHRLQRTIFLLLTRR